jgi:hypothetical protein
VYILKEKKTTKSYYYLQNKQNKFGFQKYPVTFKKKNTNEICWGFLKKGTTEMQIGFYYGHCRYLVIF